jgi:quercetin dioxygenase-like cupin family protein
MEPSQFISDATNRHTIGLDWGEITWLVSGEAMAGAEMTVGLVTIRPGKRNPLHSHPNCEETLYVLSGSCDHLLDGELYRLSAGQAIRIPRGVRHWAKCLGDEPLVAVIAFSSPDRNTQTHEEGGVA